MITLRIDVDYAYSNRLKSFLATFLNVKLGKGYLENSKIIAKMINASSKDIKAYWFFTTQTAPDCELFNLINNSKHEVCLHAVKNVYEEWMFLERHFMRLFGKKSFEYMLFEPKIKYYNVHGVKRFLMKIIWHKTNRGLTQKLLLYFSNNNTVGLDMLCSCVGQRKAYEIAKGFQIIYFHPDWLFQTGKLNRRGRFFEVLEKLLLTDNKNIPLLEEVIV